MTGGRDRRAGPGLGAALAATLLALLPATAAGRTLAVLEYRAGVRGGQALASAMATQIGQLTSHRVLSPDEAQRLFGPDLNAVVARCKGDPRCIGGIGQRLRADEVILVGLSELGDLIVAIQRIDAASGEVLARLADSTSRRQRVSRAVIVGYLRRLLPPDDFRRYGHIIVRTVGKPGDRVFLDDTLQGSTPLRPIRVPAPGRYTVRVTRPGHIDSVTRIEVPPEASVEVTPTLNPRSRVAKKRWYERWWVWAIVGGVVAGGATATAILVQPGPSNVDAVVRWQPR